MISPRQLVQKTASYVTNAFTRTNSLNSLKSLGAYSSYSSPRRLSQASNSVSQHTQEYYALGSSKKSFTPTGKYRNNSILSSLKYPLNGSNLPDQTKSAERPLDNITRNKKHKHKFNPAQALKDNLKILFPGNKHKEIRKSANAVAGYVEKDSYTDHQKLYRQNNNLPCAYVSLLNGIHFKNEYTLSQLKEKLEKFSNTINLNNIDLISSETVITASQNGLHSLEKIISKNQQLFGSSSRLENFTLSLQSAFYFLIENAKSMSTDDLRVHIQNIDEIRNKINQLKLKSKTQEYFTPHDLVNSMAEHAYHNPNMEHFYKSVQNLKSDYRTNGNDGSTSSIPNTFKVLENKNAINPFLNIQYHDKKLYQAQIDFVVHTLLNVNKNNAELRESMYKYLQGNPLLTSGLKDEYSEPSEWLEACTDYAMEFVKNFKKSGLILTSPIEEGKTNIGHHQGIFYDRRTKEFIGVNSLVDDIGDNKNAVLEGRIHTGNLYNTQEVVQMLQEVARNSNYCLTSINQGQGTMPVYSLRTAHFLNKNIQESPQSNYFKDRLQFVRGQS